MSSPRFPFSRRRFLTVSATMLGALSVRGLPIHAAAAAHFTHGVASGDPLQDRVILWTRVLPGSGRAETVNVQWQVASDQRFDNLIATGDSQTGPDRDFTVKVDATGLEAGLSYFYRFIVDGVTSPVGRTRTLPPAGVAQARLAVVSCSNYPQGYFNVYREVAARDCDAVLHLGDYIYEYAEGGYASAEMLDKGRNVQPEHEIVSLEDYRMRYGLYRSDADLQAVHQAHAFICVWDDHEITNNTFKTGAQNHNPDRGEGAFDDRRNAAIQAFYEWLPIREQSSIADGIIYRSFDIGDLATLIMLDTRLVARDEQLTHEMNIDTLRRGLADPVRTMLGTAQQSFLESELRRSSAAGIPWQVIGQQVIMGRKEIPLVADEAFAGEVPDRYRMLRERGQMGLPLNLDAWDGYPADRERVLDLFRRHASNAVVLAGDTHSSWAFDLHDDDGDAIAVEFGTPSVSSPGFENFMPLPEAELVAAFMRNSPEMRYMRALGRGWVELDITREQVAAQFLYVSTVLEQDYQVEETEALVSFAGEHVIR
ncbi:alkaline phosphatase D family protein [Pseudohongiella sp.]|nr:alkaline phosphatase D family protein [Pseudohongiella sp.]HDZ07709.1 alkaline phosphatase [Pseudohongiella sp.]HEA63289.1 alkaline phosphatase [Pseudohongiella sp.]